MDEFERQARIHPSDYNAITRLTIAAGMSHLQPQAPKPHTS